MKNEKALKELLIKDVIEFMAIFMATENLDLLNSLSGWQDSNLRPPAPKA